MRARKGTTDVHSAVGESGKGEGGRMRVPLYARPDVSHTGHGGHALSPNHLQQTFKRVVGVSPKTFRDFRRLARLKEHLRRAHSVASASYAAGAGLDPLVVRESL
jgi:hypothetical protein